MKRRFVPEADGFTHVNVYSKGKTELGRFLSNFTDFHISTEDGPFRTIEGYWYWLSSRDERLRLTNGFDSKKLGRSISAQEWLRDPEFKNKIRKAIIIKIVSNSEMLDAFIVTKLPFTHYYVYGEKVIDVPQAGWIVDFLEWLRHDLKQGE